MMMMHAAIIMSTDNWQ